MQINPEHMPHFTQVVKKDFKKSIVFLTLAYLSFVGFFFILINLPIGIMFSALSVQSDSLTSAIFHYIFFNSFIVILLGAFISGLITIFTKNEKVYMVSRVILSIFILLAVVNLAFGM